jgi:hypothetical protein
MIRRQKILAAAITCLFFSTSSNALGQSPLEATESSGGRSGSPSTTFHHVWTHPGSWWIGEQVGIGNHGTQVFTHYYLNDTAAALLSVHDGDPPLPVWELDTHPDNPMDVDSADYSDVHVGITRTDTGTMNQYVVKLSKYSSQGRDWVYTYPHLTTGRMIAAVSADGQTIVSVISNPITSRPDLLVFDPDSPIPTASFALPAGGAMKFDLATNGERAVIIIDLTVYVVEIATGNILLANSESSAYGTRGLGISGDGSVVASGQSGNGLRLYEWNGSTYVPTWFHVTPGGVRALDVSEDGSTVAYGIGFAYPSTRIVTECVDVPTKTVTMSEDISSFGQYQNTVWEVAISADGEIFATATFGDEPDIVEEVRVYHKHRSVPIRTLNLLGSAFSIDVSPDGKWVVAGSKAVHGNESGHGGQIDLLHLGGTDLAVYTTPSVGSTVTFETFGNPGSPALLLHSPTLASSPVVFPEIGTLYLTRSSMSVIPMGPIGPGGSASLPWTVPGPVGTTHYFQGFQVAPRRLSECWVPVTFLP